MKIYLQLHEFWSFIFEGTIKQQQKLHSVDPKLLTKKGSRTQTRKFWVWYPQKSSGMGPRVNMTRLNNIF